jgi:hypothetical protein
MLKYMLHYVDQIHVKIMVEHVELIHLYHKISRVHVQQQQQVLIVNKQLIFVKQIHHLVLTMELA